MKKKMKKFFIKNIYLSCIFLLIIYFFSWFWLNYINEMSVKFLDLDHKGKNIKLKILNVGSSHGCYGIKYPVDVKGYNLGLSSQNFYFDYKILKKYLHLLDEKSIVIIPISIFNFYNSCDNENIIFNYVPILDKDEFSSLTNFQYFLGKYFSITQPLSKIFKFIKYLNISLKKREISKVFIEYPQDLSKEKKQEAAIETSLKHLNVDESNINEGINTLKKILFLLESRNIKIILITTPQTYLYNEQVGEKNYQERIYNNIKEAESEMNKKYLYLDYSHDKRFVKNLEYFFDDDHLNEKGAEYFTEILLNDIKAHGYNFE